MLTGPRRRLKRKFIACPDQQLRRATTSGFRDGAPRVVRGTFPSAGLGRRVVPHHLRPIGGEEPFDCEDADHRPSPGQGGRETHCASAAVSSTTELVLGRSPGETSQVEVMNELTRKFQKLEELCS
jgi:hypothetical protein